MFIFSGNFVSLNVVIFSVQFHNCTESEKPLLNECRETKILLCARSSILFSWYLLKFLINQTFCWCRMDPKRAENMEMSNGNAYPTLPLLDKPKAPFLESP
jgi:hypothetical protein